MASIVNLINDIESVFEKADSIWLNRKKFSVKYENKLRARIRPLHLLIEQLSYKLWKEYQKVGDEDLDEIERRKVWNGQKYVTRIIWCDGVFHYVTTKKRKFLYIYRCGC